MSAVLPITLNISLDDADSTVFAGTKRSLLCTEVDQGSFFLQSRSTVYTLFDIEYYPLSKITTNSSRVIEQNITGSIAQLDFNPIQTSDGDEYIYVGYRIYNGTSKVFHGLIHLNVTSK